MSDKIEFDDPIRVYLNRKETKELSFMAGDSIDIGTVIKIVEVLLRANIAKEIEAYASAEETRLKSVTPEQLSLLDKNWVGGIREGARVAKGT